MAALDEGSIAILMAVAFDKLIIIKRNLGRCPQKHLKWSQRKIFRANPGVFHQLIACCKHNFFDKKVISRFSVGDVIILILQHPALSIRNLNSEARWY